MLLSLWKVCGYFFVCLNHFKFPDTFHARYAMRHCNIRETTHFTSFDCPHEPTYILSRKCLPTKGGGPGPCCKVDELFTYLTMDRPDVYSHIKYALHCDDDTYFRTDQVLRWLARIESTGISTYPLVASPNGNDPRENIYSIQECEEVHTNGWYQPFMLNKASMELVKAGFSAYGTMWTCNNFKVTHDVGMGPFFWMYGLYHLGLPDTYVGNHGNAIARMITHSVKHGHRQDDCDNRTAYSEEQLVNQKVVLGCGTVDENQKWHLRNTKDWEGHDLYNDMYDLWNHFKEKADDIDLRWQFPKQTATLYPPPADGSVRLVKHWLEEWEHPESDGTFKGDKVEMVPIPLLLQLRGYNTTKHSKEFDIVKEWKNFTMSDCAIEGYKGFKKKPRPGAAEA